MGMQTVVAVDPGTTLSGVVVCQVGKIVGAEVRDNAELVRWLRDVPPVQLGVPWILALERVSHYGAGVPVGREVFDTVRWTGRFQEAWRGRVCLVERTTAKLHLCSSRNAKPAGVRQAILDRWGGDSAALGNVKCRACDGTGRTQQQLPCPKCNARPGGCVRCFDSGHVAGKGPCKTCGGAKRSPPGPLAGLSDHLWSALAVGMTALDGLGEYEEPVLQSAAVPALPESIEDQEPF